MSVPGSGTPVLSPVAVAGGFAAGMAPAGIVVAAPVPPPVPLTLDPWATTAISINVAAVGLPRATPGRLAVLGGRR